MLDPATPTLSEARECLVEYVWDSTLCPVLGAGASRDAGMPTWDGLLNGIARQLGIGHGAQLPGHACSLNTTLPPASPPALRAGPDIAWLLEAARCDERTLRETLYRDHNARAATWTTTPGFDEDALRKLAELCIAVAHATPSRRFHVITYNVDTLLEEAIVALGHGAKALTSRGTATWPINRSIRLATPCTRGKRVIVRVAHVHGVVPNVGDPRPVLAPVLGAHDYDVSMQTPFSDHNLWQIAAFVGFNCLFYGWSFQDYAVRQLLRVASRCRQILDPVNLPQHFALVRATPATSDCALTRATAPLLADFENRTSLLLKRKFGVWQIQTTSFSQQKLFITRVLQDLAESVG
jgi:hypothetical protein